jgi:hypothetical protein
MNLLVAKIAAMHAKMLADPSVKCSMQYALRAANPAKFLSSLGMIARYIAAIALRNKDNFTPNFLTFEYALRGVFFSYLLSINIPVSRQSVCLRVYWLIRSIILLKICCRLLF